MMGFKIKKTVNGETVWQPIKAKKYTTSKITEYTGSLPIAINANGDALIDYRIYGADGGVGEPTESGEPAGYNLPMIVANQNLLPDNISQFGNGYIDLYNGGVDSQDAIRKEKYCNYVSIVPNTNYIFVMANGFPGDPLGSTGVKPWRTIAFYKQNKTFIVRQPVQTGEALKSSPVTVTSPSDAFFARVSWRSYGSEECPILATYRDLPVYIGENQLDAGEYVSYSDGKIYRMVDGTLTPTDPPVPFTDIPTIEGKTIIGYDGEPKPSQMYIKYNSWSGWSDIDNHKMVNGNWTQEVT